MGIRDDLVWATVISDASFCSVTHAAGYAVWIRADGYSDPFKRHGNFLERPRNSFEAELWAAFNGIQISRRFNTNAILVQSDNTSVVDIINDRNKMAKQRRAETLMTISEGLILTARHVKGHTRGDSAARWCNNWCDAWAKKAMKEQRSKR